MKLDDLTIFLKAQDKTKGAFGKVTKRIEKMNATTKILAKGFLAIGTTASATFIAAATNGAMLNKELTRMKNSIGTTAQEADELYKIIREGAPMTNIDQLGEGILTLKEGFFDAKAESGPLFDLIKDFGADIDLNLETPREQLLEFLKAMREIPSATVRAGAAVANFGGEDAKAIITITNDMDLLEQTISRLDGTARDLTTFISLGQIQNMNDAQAASASLSNAWDDLSTTAYSLVAPALAFISEKLSALIGWFDGGIKKAGEFLGIFNDAFADPKNIKQADQALAAVSEQISEIVDGAKELKKLHDEGGIRLDMSADPFRTNELAALRAQQKLLIGEKARIQEDAAALAAITTKREEEKKLKAATDAAKLLATKTAEKLRSTFESEARRISSDSANQISALEFMGVSEISNVGDNLPKMEAKSLQRILGLDVTPAQRDSLIELLRTEYAHIKNAVTEGIGDDGFVLGNAFGVIPESDPSEDLKKAADAATFVKDSFKAARDEILRLGESFAKTKTQARIFVGIQHALAIVNAYSAATRALNDIGSPTPFQKFAAYSAVLAKGLAGAAAIKKAGASLGGGGGGGAISGSASGPTSISAQSRNDSNQPQNQNQNSNDSGGDIVIQLSGGGILGEEMLSELVEQLNRRGLSRKLRTAT